MRSRNARARDDDVGGRRPTDLQATGANDIAGLIVLPVKSLKQVNLVPLVEVIGIGAPEELRMIRFFGRGWGKTRSGNLIEVLDCLHQPVLDNSPGFFLGLGAVCERGRRVRVIDIPAHQATQIADQCLPSRIGRIAGPVREVGGVGQFEDDRPVASLDDHWNQLVASIGQSRFGAHPTRCDGAAGPKDDDGLGRPQFFLDDFIECLAGTQHGIPPHGESFLSEGFRKVSGRRPFLTAVRNEDVMPRHARSPARTISRRLPPARRYGPPTFRHDVLTSMRLDHDIFSVNRSDLSRIKAISLIG